MTEREALNWEPIRKFWRNNSGANWDELEAAIKEALAQPKQDNTYIYASSLATAIWQKHYMKESPKFALLDTTEGVLIQIDNMTCGLVREKPAQPEQEPIGYLCENAVEHRYFRWKKPPSTYKPIALYTTPQQRTEERNFCPRCGKRTADLTVIHTCTPPKENT